MRWDKRDFYLIFFGCVIVTWVRVDTNRLRQYQDCLLLPTVGGRIFSVIWRPEKRSQHDASADRYRLALVVEARHRRRIGRQRNRHDG